MSEGHNPAHFARQMVRFLRNTVVAKVAGMDSPLLQISSDERARVGRVAAQFSEEDLARFLNILLRTNGELGYKREQRFHLELGLLKLVHAQRLLPVEELLSGVTAAPAQRAVERPSVARPEPSRAGPAARPKGPSPFEADKARKSTPEMSAAYGSAAGAAPAPAAEAQPASDVRSQVITALENARKRTLANLLDSAAWSCTGDDLLITVAAPAAVLELELNGDTKRILTAAASHSAGRPLRVHVVAGATTNGTRQTNGGASPNGSDLRQGNGGAGGRIADDPVIRRMQEKFGAEIRTVLDYRDRR
jgi:DNA polymerase-3 subunit gamma/tau